MPILAPGMPGISKFGMPPPVSATSISISLSSSRPSRSFLRKVSRVAGLAVLPTSASSTRSSALICALRLHLVALLLAHQADGRLDQVAHDLLDVAADIADLGELRCLDLDERRAGEPGQTAGDLRLADAGRADHQDVLGHHLFAHLPFELLPAPAVAQRDGDGALGVVLADDVAVELRHGLAGGKVGHACSLAQDRRSPTLTRRHPASR